MPNVSTRQTPVSRRRLESLWENIVAKSEISVSEESEVTDKGLEKYHIQRIHFDFEKLDGNEGTNLSLEPPVLFLPISPEVFNSHPIDQDGFGSVEEREDQMEFRDYNPPANADKSELQDGFWTPEDCAMELSRYLWYWAVSWPRVNLLQGFAMKYNIDQISDPSPILRGQGLDCLLDTEHHKAWETQYMLEHPTETADLFTLMSTS